MELSSQPCLSLRNSLILQTTNPNRCHYSLMTYLRLVDLFFWCHQQVKRSKNFKSKLLLSHFLQKNEWKWESHTVVAINLLPLDLLAFLKYWQAKFPNVFSLTTCSWHQKKKKTHQEFTNSPTQKFKVLQNFF